MKQQPTTRHVLIEDPQHPLHLGTWERHLAFLTVNGSGL